MADNTGSNNTAIVAIVVLVVLALGAFFYFKGFGPTEHTTSSGTVIESNRNTGSRGVETPNTPVETPRNRQ